MIEKEVKQSKNDDYANNIIIDTDNILTDITNSNYIYIYSIYKTINNNIDIVKSKLYDNINKLDNIIKQNGPQPVNAQNYDSLVKSSGKAITPVVELIAEIDKLKKKIDKLNLELSLLEKEKDELYKLILFSYKEISKIKEVDAEFTVFVHRYILNKTLYETVGVTNYTYNYVGNLSSVIMQKLKRC